MLGPAVALMAAAGCAPGDRADEVRCRADLATFDACVREVRAAIGEGRADDAVRDWERRSAEMPESWLPVWFQAMAREFSGRDGSRADARAFYARALRLAEDADASFGIAQARLALGSFLQHDDHELSSALEEYTAAAAAAERAGAAGASPYRSAAFRAASVERSLGRFTEEARWLDRALQRTGPDTDSRTLNYLYNSLCNVHRVLGDTRRAAEFADLALELARRNEDAEGQARALQLRGVLELDANAAESVDWFERAENRAREAGRDDLANHMRVLGGIALVYLDRFSEAEQRFAETLDTSLGFAEADDGMQIQAVANLLYLADAQRGLGRLDDAVATYARARETAARWSKKDYVWQILAGSARTHLAAGRVDEALADAHVAVAEIEGLRSSVPQESQRVYFLRRRANAYATLASALSRQTPDDVDAPFAVMERIHARTLRESLHERFAPGSEMNAPSTADVREALAGDELLVEYVLGEDESLLIAIDRGGASLHRLPPRKEIEAAVEEYRAALVRPQTHVDARSDPERDFRRHAAAGVRLREMLLDPVGARLAAAKRLIVVPDKQLHRLPFGTLPAGDPTSGALRFVADAHELRYLPAAAFAVASAPRRGSGVLLAVADGGDPALGLPPLAASAREVEDARRAHGGAIQVLDGEALSGETVETALRGGDFGVLHVVGHVVLDGVSGPQIVLPPDPETGSRFLTADDIVAWAPTPPLVLLSACETGEGELVGGEGLLGLVRAFELAGSRQVVATLWPVEDGAAAAVMGGLHAALGRGRGATNGLSVATSAYRGDGKFVHPFYWGAFVLYGSD